jgi:hypothetical protein
MITGFKKRAERKLSPRTFLELLLFRVYEQGTTSLTDYVQDVQLHCHKSIKKQSINERFNESAVLFVKKILSEQLGIKLKPDISDSQTSFFKGIYIQDSTKFALPDHMKDEYPGYGGLLKAEALASIHFKYELFHGEIEELKIVPGTYADQQLARDGLDTIKKDHLYLNDLGFFSLDLIDKIQNEQAFFISRIKPKMNLYILKNDKYTRIDLSFIKNELKKGNRKYYDFNGFIGSKRKQKIPVRYIITSVPEEVYEKRIRRVNKQNKGYGNKTSEKYKQYAQLNIFITNLGTDEFKAADILKLYRLRWQVELIFKTWKSNYKINHIKKVNSFRVMCQLYVSLLLAIINWTFFSWLTTRYFKSKGNWLSIMKYTKQMKNLILEQRIWLRDIKTETSSFIRKLTEINSDLISLEKRKKRYNFVEILLIVI